MKVKNIAFSGFAAVILASVCGNAMAAVSLASKTYVDEGLATKANLIDLEALQTTVGQKATQESLEVVATQVNTNTTDIANLKSGKQDSLVAGTNISIVDNTISATGLVTTEKLVEIQTVLQDAIDEKQAAGDYAQASELETLKTTVENLQTGNVDKTVVENLQTSVETIAADYAKKSELTATEERLDAAIKAIVIPTIPTLVSAFENDAGYITSAALTDYAKTADVDTALATKADKSALDDLVTSEELGSLRTALETEIAKKQAAGDYVTAEGLKEVSDALAELKNDSYTRAEIDQKITDAISGGQIDLSGYAKTSQLEALTLLVNGNTDEITALKSAGYQTASDVQGAITTATADLATKSELNAKQDKLTAGTNITIENGVIAATGGVTADELAEVQTALEAAIAEKQEKGEYLVAADLTELNNAITALQTGKADTSTVTTIQETISKLGDTYATKADMTAADEALQSAIDNMDLSAYAKTADLAAVAISGQYADLQGKPEIPSVEGLATSEELNTLRTTLEASIAEKQDKGEYLVASDLTELNNAITALQTGKADASTVTTIQETISKLGDTYATKADMTAADEALQAAIDAIDIPSLDAYAKTADVDAALALKADKSELSDLVTSEQLTALRTALEAEIANKQAAGDYAQAETLQNVANELGTLKNNVYTKAEVDQKIADAATGGSVDLSGYATTSALDALTALVDGKQDKLTAGAGITITDNTISADVDTSSLITKPATQPDTFGEYVLILNINEAGESEGYSWLDTLDLMGGGGFDM